MDGDRARPNFSKQLFCSQKKHTASLPLSTVSHSSFHNHSAHMSAPSANEAEAFFLFCCQKSTHPPCLCQLLVSFSFLHYQSALIPAPSANGTQAFSPSLLSNSACLGLSAVARQAMHCPKLGTGACSEIRDEGHLWGKDASLCKAF